MRHNNQTVCDIIGPWYIMELDKSVLIHIGGTKVMKTIVIYKSKTGFTKKYAQWIASYDRPVDFTRSGNIDQLVDFVNHYE